MKEYSYTKRALLRELSENSRSSVTQLAKKLKCSRNTIISNIKWLEKEFGIRYIVQLDKEAIGLIQNQMLTIRFDKKPKPLDIEDIFKNDHFVQLILETEGDFDLIMVRKVPATSVDGGGEKYVHWGIKTLIQLLPYGPKIDPTMPVLTHIGYTPLLTDTIDKLDLTKFGMDELDKRIIMALNENSRLNYRAISKKLGVDVGTVRYRMRILTNRSIIRRFTIVLTNLPTQYNIAFMVNYNLSPDVKERYREAFEYYSNIDGSLPLVNKFQYLALTMGNHLFYGIGCFEDKSQAMKEAIEIQKELYKKDNISIKHARITKVIKGYLPVRNIDIAKEFKHIKWDKM
jgi:DNA-binding Lrp family transcriptional regulator